MISSVLLDARTGRPIVDRDLRAALEARDLGSVAAKLELARLFPGIVGAERNPPLYMDVSNAYSGDELGLPWRDVIGEGIVGSGDLLVSAHGGANSIDIAKGSAWVLGDTNPDLQPNYRAFNDATVNLGISPDGANPRRVRVVAQIIDQGFAGSGRLWQLQALHGTPAGSPALPAEPASAISLCDVLVPAAAASSAAYTFTDLRSRAVVTAGQALGPQTGAYVSTTVAGLGTGYDGKIGWIRAGATPYTFLRVTYSATLGKWVSDEISWRVANASNQGINGVYVVVGGTTPPQLPWRVLDTAGLKPQFRAIFRGSAVSGDTGSARLAYDAADAGAAEVGLVGITGGALTGWSTDVVRAIDWQDIPGGYTVKDYLFPSFQSATSSGTVGRLGYSYITIAVRWVG